MSEIDDKSEPTQSPKTPFTPPDDESLATPPATQAPLGPQRPSRPVQPQFDPYLSYTFLALNIIAFLASQALGRTADGIPVLWAFGWKQNTLIVEGEYWRLVTPIFLHGSIAHLFFNSYALYILGPFTERALGYVRFFFIYMLSGIAGVIASFAFTSGPSIGASGAIFGLIGAQLAYFYRNREVFGGMGRHRVRSLLQVAGINLLIGLAPGIDNWGHIGGLIGGAALSWVLGPIFIIKPALDGTTVRLEDSAPLEQRWWAIPFAAAVLITLTAIIINLRAGLQP